MEEEEEQKAAEPAAAASATAAAVPTADQVAPPAPIPIEKLNPLGLNQSSLDAEGDEDMPPLVGKASASSSSSSGVGRPGPYSAKKGRVQSEAPDTLQLALDIAAALAKAKDASNTLPAPASTASINLVEPVGAAAGNGAAADPSGLVSPPTLPSSG